jgi:hypothetical protein
LLAGCSDFRSCHVYRPREPWIEDNVLAGGPVGAEVGGLEGGGGLVVLVGLLDEKGDTTILSGDDTDGLFQ